MSNMHIGNHKDNLALK